MCMLDDEVVVGKNGDEGFISNLSRSFPGSKLLHVLKPAESLHALKESLHALAESLHVLEESLHALAES